MQGGLFKKFKVSHITCCLVIKSIVHILNRATETEEQIQKRLQNARAELEQGKSSGLFDHILVNDDLETCYEKLKVILVKNSSFPILYINKRLI